VKLAERSVRDEEPSISPANRDSRPDKSSDSPGPGELGLTLVEIDRAKSHRFDVPDGMTGLLVQRVEPLSPAYDAGIERGSVILEVNRQQVDSVARFRRVLEATGGREPLTVFLYVPEIEQRNIKTIRMER
jgi:S1-C subfamily serine protease